MAIIPSNEKFIGLSASVDTTERRSALINAESQAYTMQDITDTVASGLPPATNPTISFLPTNWAGEFADAPISAGIAPAGYIGWSTLRTRIAALTTPPPGVDQTNIAPYVKQYGLSVINSPLTGANTIIGDYAGIFGPIAMRLNLETPLSGVPKAYINSGASVGLTSVFYVDAYGEEIRLGQGYTYTSSSLANGIYASSALGMIRLNGGIASPDDGIFTAFMGIARIGLTNSAGIGVNYSNGSMLIGAELTNTIPPVDPVNAVQWVKVVDHMGTEYKFPLYQ